DNRLGTPTVTAAAAGLTSGTQQEVIDADLGVYGLNDDNVAGTLRYAINHATAGQTIAFEASLVGTIHLTAPSPTLAAGVNIIGPNSNIVTVDGSAVPDLGSGLFAVGSGAVVTITDLTVFGANNTGISNSGTLTLKRMNITANVASSVAGAA